MVRAMAGAIGAIVSTPFVWVWGKMTLTVRIISIMLMVAIALFEQVSPVHWLALTMYYEARGEGISSRYGVANVVLNRMQDKRWSNTVKGVVHGGLNRGMSCDFTFMCDGTKRNPWAKRANWIPWLRIRLEAFGIYVIHVLSLRYDTTGYAVFYKRSDTASPWFRKRIAAQKMTRTVHIGAHEFFR